MGVVTRPALGRVTKVLERLVAAVGETTGPSSTRHARSRPGGDFARVSPSADARDRLRDAVTRGHPRRSPRSDPRLDPTRERGRRGRDVPHGTARGFAALAASPPRREREDGDFPADTRVAAGHELSEAAAEETEVDLSLVARSRDDPHDDESGKTPRAAFHARMRASLAARDPAEALRVFDELSDVYPDDQGAPAYDALMHMAALAGDPDARATAVAGQTEHSRRRRQRARCSTPKTTAPPHADNTAAERDAQRDKAMADSEDKKPEKKEGGEGKLSA